MPPRVARSSIQSSSQPAKARSNPRNPKKAAKRALNAFSIAQYENPEKVKISRNRLGEVEGSSQRKRPRDEDEDEEEDEDEDGEPQRRKRRSGEETFDEGSDSDGNTWTMGHIDVDDDDDEDIDSDEAFGESDEERFEDFAFSGSSSNKKGKSKKPRKQQDLDEDDEDIDMDEGDSADGEEEDDDDLGDDAIDLATALDQYEEEEAEERRRKEKKKKKASAFDSSDEAPSEGEDVAADGASDFSSDEDEDEDDEDDRQAQLKDLISSLATESEEKARGRRVEVHESAVPDEFGVARKVDLLSFKPKVADEEKKRALKLLQDDKSSKRTDIARKLDAPLPKRQQDKLDRAAANAKANETLERWTDTIKRNRRAEHLMFPLQNKSGGEAVGEHRLQPTTTSAPANDLESTILSILQQSGLSNGKDDEDQLQKREELEMNKLPIEVVMRNRAKLRLERELLFREEIRAKRIKKIKSKAYRRVHRKEREKLMEKERNQLKDDGVDISEEEREYNDRRRAEERMGAKHRESKWAKGIKATGRAAWDQDALDGVTEMARRNEELRRRVEGKAVRGEDEDDSDIVSDDDESEDGSDVENADDAALQRSLGKLKQNPFSTDTSKLGQMAFMQRSEAARRKQNDEDIERMRRELAGEDSQSDAEVDNSTKVGRRTYGPGKDLTLPGVNVDRNEFEEHLGSDEDDVNDRQVAPSANGLSNGSRSVAKPTKNGLFDNAAAKQQKSKTSTKPADTEFNAPNPFLMKAKKEKKSEADKTATLVQAEPTTTSAQGQSKSRKRQTSKAKAAAEPQEITVDPFLQQRITATDDDGWATVIGGQDDDEDDQEDLEEEGIDLDLVLRNQALTAKGFAGDNVAAEFESEKKATVQDEESTEITTELPGWGAWTGEGMTPAQKKRNQGYKTVTKREGIDAEKRKDKKLDKVIINERRQKPNVKYMASQLPFPFETKEQYERSLRVPKGKEWTTKKTFQAATKPRVIVKQGVIAPLRKPLV
ncbi:Utp14 protein-domain-containing protein [Paraphoma chrysanthemicola]|uniref:Utp14 protein-domain-containing protein n=1 Tax=Paraphoma chrysanthemicola TaxID=798071 RepID=A0A8K0RHB2_9PLEO|nr:Utp14 protein-domain-containing protein [Paraphoma chrysanthemicola]